MYEPEVQPLIAFSSRGLEIDCFLLRRQLLPLPLFAVIPPNVVLLHCDVQENVEHCDGNQGTVTLLCGRSVSAVIRSVQMY
jgi:hypothetical protein